MFGRILGPGPVSALRANETVRAALGTAANPLNNAVVYGVGGAAAWHNFVVSGEYYRIDANRQGLATNTFDGGYIEGTWVITGERRPYSPTSGGYLRPTPEHPFSPWDGQWGSGAFELAARYSTINLNDRLTTCTATSTTASRPRRAAVSPEHLSALRWVAGSTPS